MFSLIKSNLCDHLCKSYSSNEPLAQANNDSSLMMTDDLDENKENTVKKKKITRNKKRLSSPSADELLQQLKLENNIEISLSNTPTNPAKVLTAKSTNKRRKFKTETPKTSDRKSLSSPFQKKLNQNNDMYDYSNVCTTTCDCLASKLVLFQLNVYYILNNYSKIRVKMFDIFKNLAYTRTKIKEQTQVLTNTDNLHLQPAKTSNLICPEFCDETGFHMDCEKEMLTEDLMHCMKILRLNKSQLCSIVNDDHLDLTTYQGDKALKKQFYDSVDLLAHFFGFLGHNTHRCEVLKLKFEMLCFEKSKFKDQSQLTTNWSSNEHYSVTFIHLSKAYLSENKCDEFEELSEIFFDESIKLEETKDAKRMRENVEELFVDVFEPKKFLSNKAEIQLTYLISLAHYLVLKKKVSFKFYLII
jgi:hypothetical protein